MYTKKKTICLILSFKLPTATATIHSAQEQLPQHEHLKTPEADTPQMWFCGMEFHKNEQSCLYNPTKQIAK